MSSPANKKDRVMPRLSEFDVERIASAVAEKILLKREDKDPELGRKAAALYCSISVREFDRERLRFPKVLVEARSSRPVLFRRSTLDVYRASRAGLTLRSA